MPQFTRLVIAFLICFLSYMANAQNYVFARLGGSPVNTNGWNLQGAARIGNIVYNDQSEVIVCPVNGSSGAIFYNQPINLSLCSKWKAEFDFRMHDGTGADGLAFCFLDVPPSGFVSGAGLGIPLTANGLKVCFDTWNNCIPFNGSTVHLNMPKVEIRYGSGYDECSSMPTKDNSDNSISFIADTSYKHAKITYDDGNISVYVNDVLYITGFQQFNYSGYLGFTASTGGYNDNHTIRNAIIYTEMPPSDAGKNTAACPNTSVQLGTANNTDYVYSWTPATGLSATNISNPVLTLDNTGLLTESHLYLVKTSFKIKPGCSSVDSVTVQILPRPKVNFTMPDICLNDATAAFKDSSYSGEPSLLPLRYFWRFGDPNATVLNPDTSTMANPSHKYSAAANYNVSLMVMNNGGCIDSLKQLFTVNGAVPKSNFNVLNPTGLCSNTTVQVQDASSVDFGKITNVMIYWGDTNTTPLVDDNPVAGKIYGHNYPENLTANAKTYNVRYVVYSGITCVDEMTKTITVNGSPKVVFGAIPSLCTNDNPYQVTEASETTGLSGALVYSGNGISSTGVINPAIGAGSYSFLATFNATNGCNDSAVSGVIIYPFPVVDAGPTLYLLQGGQITINATATNAGNTAMLYNWTPASYLDDPAILNPVATPPSDILYTLNVTGEGGCKNSDTVRVIVLKNPNIPNVFSPNGDAINDTWAIRYLNTYPGCVVEVFDRYGQLVFRSTGYNNPWDGTVNGKPVPVGVYYYIVDTKKHPQPFTGSVMVIR